MLFHTKSLTSGDQQDALVQQREWTSIGGSLAGRQAEEKDTLLDPLLCDRKITARNQAPNRVIAVIKSGRTEASNEAKMDISMAEDLVEMAEDFFHKAQEYYSAEEVIKQGEMLLMVVRRNLEVKRTAWEADEKAFQRAIDFLDNDQTPSPMDAGIQKQASDKVMKDAWIAYENNL